MKNSTKLNRVIINTICHLQCHAGSSGGKTIMRSPLSQHDASLLADQLMNALGIDNQAFKKLNIFAQSCEFTHEELAKAVAETEQRQREMELDEQDDRDAAEFEAREHRAFVAELQADAEREETCNQDAVAPYDDQFLSELAAVNAAYHRE